MLAFSFLFFFAMFLLVGLLSARLSKADVDDYLVAGRKVPAWLVALSAVATNNSGFMFIGLIGTAYKDGLSALWIMVGWIGGDYIAWRIGLFEKMRAISEKWRTVTVPGVLAGHHEHSIHGHQRGIRIITGVILFVFLGSYAGAQLGAGGKALYEIFNWSQATGALIGAGVVLLYSWAGGIRASIWTDAAQSIVMFLAMLTMLIISVDSYGGLTGMWASLEKIPNYTSLWPAGMSAPWIILFIVGWLAAGFGVIGQPHIFVRAMVAKDTAAVEKARPMYFAWYISFTLMCYAVALVARLIITESGGFDPELALPRLSKELLPEILTGFVLAGIFAATMSTADSQILSCSASISLDIFVGGRSYMRAKLATITVTLLALSFALVESNVFALVAAAWSSLAASFAPLLWVRLTGRSAAPKTALTMVLAGLGAALLWRYGLQYHNYVFDALPGMLAGFSVYFIGRKIEG